MLAAVACCAAIGIGKEPNDVEIAFARGLDKAATSQAAAEQPAEAPLPPQPSQPRTLENNSDRPMSPVAEPLPSGMSYYPSGAACSPPCSACEAPYATHSYVDHPCYHWPVIAPMKRHWVTVTKPHLQATHWGYPEYFEERPYGTYVLQAEQMQIANGLRDQQVLYDYDFLAGDEKDILSPRGTYELRKIIRRMEMVPSPIIIQTAIVDPKLDDARKQHVLDALQAAGVPVSPDMVVVDRPPVPGLQGVEASLIYGNLLGQTQERGGGFDYTDDFGGGRPSSVFIGGGIGINQPQE